MIFKMKDLFRKVKKILQKAFRRVILFVSSTLIKTEKFKLNITDSVGLLKLSTKEF